MATALVTGASAGLGVAYAERLAAKGFDLVLVARRRERLDELAKRLEKAHRIKAEVLLADLTSAKDVAKVEKRLAGDDSLELLVNNAGFGGYKPFVEVEPEVIDDLVQIHVLTVARLTRAALPAMVKRKKGGVINVASLLALSGTLPSQPLPFRATYAGAKAFITTFTQTLAGELAGTGVRVEVCLPGIVDTEFHTAQGMNKLPGGMAAPDVVTASLAALERGEVVCVPGLDDPSLVDRLGEAQRAVMSSANRPALAARYKS